MGYFALHGGTTAERTDAAYQTGATTTASVSTKTPGANADVTFNLSIVSPEPNFGAVNTATPPQATLHPAGSAPIIGDVVGVLLSTPHLGLANQGCSAPLLGVEFVLLNAEPNDSVGNVNADESPDGAGRLATLMNDNGAGNDSTPGPQSPVNELAAGVDRYPTFLEKLFDDNGTPVFPAIRYFGGFNVVGSDVTLNFMVFSPGALGAFESPNIFNDLRTSRLGYVSISVLNDPTAPAAAGSISDFCTPLTTDTTLFGQTRANPCLGPLNCTTDAQVNTPCPPSGPGNCASLAPSGRERYRNPNAGTRFFVAYHMSQRDTDGDGKENAFDPCPLTPDAYNHRLAGYDTSQDADSDGLAGPGAPGGGCDTVNNPGVDNQDGDVDPNNGNGWINRLDNCPLIPNPTQFETEVGDASTPAQPEYISAPRGGSAGDTMGDVCDLAETSCADATDNDGDGLINDGCPTVGSFPERGCLNAVDDKDENPAAGIQNDDTVVNDGCPSSAAVANGRYDASLTLNPICFGGTDADNDGYCSTSTAADSFYPLAIPADPADGDAGRVVEGYAVWFPMPITHSGAGTAPPQRLPIQVCNDGIDNDGDTLIDLLDGAAGGPFTAGSTCRPGSTPTGNAPSFLGATDTDGDGFPDEHEILIGTDPLGRCEESATGAAGTSSDWPGDNTGGAVSYDAVTTQDLSSIVTGSPTPYGKQPGEAGYSARLDVLPGPGALEGDWINVQDVNLINGFAPPMFGQRAFNGPLCTSPFLPTDVPAGTGLND